MSFEKKEEKKDSNIKKDVVSKPEGKKPVALKKHRFAKS